MDGYSRKARTIVRDYVERYGTLPTMNRIHNKFTGESERFTRWEYAEREYAGYDWTEGSFEEFIETCKNVVEEDIEKISESYLDIVWPEEITSELVVSELESYGLNIDDYGDKEGFEYIQKDDGSVAATYYYSTNRVEITNEYEISELSNDKLVDFTIYPDERLVIVAETQPANVQKVMGRFNNETDLSVNVAGDLTLVQGASEANEIVDSFIESFEQGITE